MCGKTPSSRPVRKTTGNSRPLAVCSVISVTTPPVPVGVGDLVGVGHQRDPLEEVGDRAVRVGLLELARDRDELLRGSRRGSRPAGPRRPAARRGSPTGTGSPRAPPAGPWPPMTIARSDSTRSTNPWIALTDRDAMPGASSARRSASPKVILRPLGQRLDHGLGPVADAALGHVEDAPQRDGVGRVGQHAQVGQHVAHLAALVEPHAADDLVGQPDPDEDLFEDPGLGVGAVEHRDVAGRHLVVVAEPVDLAGDERAPRRARCRRRSRRSRCPSPASDQRFFGLRSGLRAMTALAAVRMVWVER